VDVRQVAAHWKGGGHVNAAGCTIVGAYEQAKARIIAATSAAMPQMGN
jgi:nanoRNase/pAp phosphatase (c-di-AMP/oligoRNAs hydrolase)